MRLSLRVVRFALPLSLLCLVPARGALGAPSSARTVEGAGCIREAEATDCKPSAGGATVPVQASFVAGSGGATLQLPDGSTLRLTEGTELRVLPRTMVQLTPRDNTPAAVLQLTRGKAIVTLAGSPPRSAVLIKAAHGLQAIVKSGSAVVRATDDGLVVGSLSGSALIASGNDWYDVNAGKARSLKKSDAKGTVRDLLPPPELLPSTGLLPLFGGAAAPVTFAWKPVAGAEAYEVELRPSSGPATISRVAKTDSSLALRDLKPGGYALQVRAIDAEDLETPWTPVRRFNLVSIELPRGSIVMEGGAIQLPDGQKVKLRSTEGLESSINSVAVFSPPPPELGLLGGRAMLVRLRRRGDTEELRLRLEPRSVTAEVSLSPKNARWPADPVSVTIRLSTPDGRSPPADVQVVPRVTVDLEPVEVAWAREGLLFRGVVSPRRDGKAHIVRVEVADQYGFFLGRNHLEVANASEK